MPFSREAFIDLFVQYNEAFWPVQWLLVGLASLAVALAVNPRRRSAPAAGVGVSLILAFLWAWLALAYHLLYFTRINPLAWPFSAVSLIGALAFLWQGVVRRRLRFHWTGDGHAWTGGALIGFALVLYPLWSWGAGHRYPNLVTFGLPCPTTIFTIGLLGLLETPHPRGVLIVPILWSLVGVQAALLLGVPQDLGLLAAALFGGVLLARAGVRNAVTTTADTGLRTPSDE
ncbi:DUF6064 family protein [Sedimenticola hydrogenitrophicus]|uniref:DUF6064 family protein n=1 Tax=Sedimenticola hydrogenitrophicus TaxID=2967975 RepID=UPI0021A6F1A6|nr:DUF6064 family protein [Sedimenticola hydrogenitrophicus]